MPPLPWGKHKNEKKIMIKIPLSVEEAAARGATHKVVVDHTDLTVATADTAQTLKLFDAGAGRVVQFVGHELVPFKDASDAAFNTTLGKIGDATDDDRFLADTQWNENGTEVIRDLGIFPAAITAATVATADGSDAGTTQTLANALKAELNKVITDLNTIRNRGLAYLYASATAVNLIVGSQSGKKLVDIDTGSITLFFRIY